MKIIKAKLLTCCRSWINVKLDYKEFKFIDNYDKTCSNTQIWKGKNKDYFILREVKIENYEEKKNEI